jgi:hypothetical protein
LGLRSVALIAACSLAELIGCGRSIRGLVRNHRVRTPIPQRNRGPGYPKPRCQTSDTLTRCAAQHDAHSSSPAPGDTLCPQPVLQFGWICSPSTSFTPMPSRLTNPTFTRRDTGAEGEAGYTG